MINLRKEANKLKHAGYSEADAAARVCQDIVLDAISKSGMSRSVTVKGGVVMRNISGNARRATQDMDLDFVRYSISDEAICKFMDALNCLEGVKISVRGYAEELKHQDYKGKRVYIEIEDAYGNTFVSKMDLGVHNKLNIMQEECLFDIAYQEDGVSLLMNSPEQMYTEKLKSLLRFGTMSTRYKDIFDMCYLTDVVNHEKVAMCAGEYIFSDSTLAVKNFEDIYHTISRIFSNRRYVDKLRRSKKNWLELPVEDVLEKNKDFLLKINRA